MGEAGQGKGQVPAEEKYDVEGFCKEQARVGNAAGLYHTELQEFLRYGGLTSLCRAVLDKELPDPWVTAALQVVPAAAMLSVISLRIMDKLESPK